MNIQQQQQSSLLESAGFSKDEISLILELAEDKGVSIDEEMVHRFKEIKSVGEECTTTVNLMEVLINQRHLKNVGSERRILVYDGFEPSGRMHLAQAIMKKHIVNTLTNNGCSFLFWIADYFAMMNDKCGGDLDKIKVYGRYFQEIWTACGMDPSHVTYKWSSVELNNNAADYYFNVMQIARCFNISRIKRCSQIMGRDESDELKAAQIMYPLMQCNDIFHLGVDICQLGVDQRKVNMLAREYYEKGKETVAPKNQKKKGKKGLSKEHPAYLLAKALLHGNLDRNELVQQAKDMSSNPKVYDNRQAVDSSIRHLVAKEKIVDMVSDGLFSLNAKGRSLIESLNSPVSELDPEESVQPTVYRNPAPARLVQARSNDLKIVPVILSHHMLSSLKDIDKKMSKSQPDGAIFVDDDPGEIVKKISNANCPMGCVYKEKGGYSNPIFEYLHHIIFPELSEKGRKFVIEKRASNGGFQEAEYLDIESLALDYQDDVVTPQHLKVAVSREINEIIQPIRDHFNSTPELRDLLQQAKNIRSQIR